MRPHYLPNSFIKSLFDQENAKDNITPLIPHYILSSSNDDIVNKTNGNNKSNYHSKENGLKKNYWALRKSNSLTKIQKMKDDKKHNEINCLKNKPDINSYSKRIIEEEYNKMNVLERMEKIERKAKQKKSIKRSIEQKMKDMKITEERNKNYNSYYSMIKSRYKNPINLITSSTSLLLKNNNTRISNSNSNITLNDHIKHLPRQINRLTETRSDYNINSNIHSNINFNRNSNLHYKYNIEGSFTTSHKRKEDLGKLISFMYNCKPT